MMLPPGQPGHAMSWIDGEWVSVPPPTAPVRPGTADAVVEPEPGALPPPPEDESQEP